MDIVEIQCQTLSKSKHYQACLETIAKYPVDKLSRPLMYLKGVSLLKRKRCPGDLAEAKDIFETSCEIATGLKEKMKNAEMLWQVIVEMREQEATKSAQKLFLELWERIGDDIFHIRYAGALALSEVPDEAEAGHRKIEEIFEATRGHSRKQDMVWASVLLHLNDWVRFDQLRLDKKYPDSYGTLLIVSIRYSLELRSVDPTEEDQFCDLLKKAIHYAELALKVNKEDSGSKKQLVSCYNVLKKHPEYYRKFNFNSGSEIGKYISRIADSMKL